MKSIGINKAREDEWDADEAEDIAIEEPIAFWITEAEAMAFVDRGLSGLPNGVIYFKAREIKDDE